MGRACVRFPELSISLQHSFRARFCAVFEFHLLELVLQASGNKGREQELAALEVIAAEEGEIIGSDGYGGEGRSVGVCYDETGRLLVGRVGGKCF